MSRDAADELNDRDQKSLLCAACADGYHTDCELFEMREYPQCACVECNHKATARAESREQEEISDYYGGDGVRPLGEQTLKAWEEHKR